MKQIPTRKYVEVWLIVWMSEKIYEAISNNCKCISQVYATFSSSKEDGII